MSQALSDFAVTVSKAGLNLSEPAVVDGKIHRFASAPDTEKNSWYALHNYATLVSGAFGCWRKGFIQKWSSKERGAMSRDEWSQTSAAWKLAEQARAAEESAGHAEARKQCAALFRAAPPAKDHPYLKSKNITPSGAVRISNLELTSGWLAIPLQDMAGVIHSAQFIADDGTKRFCWRGRVSGCFHLISRPDAGGPILICEGYATGATLHAATGWTVACAMNCGNLAAVTKSFRAADATRTLLIAADNDQFTEGNPGLSKAQAAAKSANALVALPEFADEALAHKPTDFNDLHLMVGLDEVRRQIHSAVPTLRLLASRQFNPHIEPPPLRPIYTLDDKVICTPGNLSSITSAIKTGKSSVINAAMASSFPHNGDCDLLGFESANPKGLAIVHCDSEQARDDHWHQINRAVRRVHLKAPPPWFYSYCLTGLGHKAALACYLEAIRIATDKHGGILSTFLDGLADFVSDVNDAAECNAFVAQLQDLAMQYECPTIGVIHFNHGTDKTRGHLGSQFERKAETNLRLDKTNGITTIWSEKQRRAPIPKGTGPSFQWDDEAQMHLSCDPSLASTTAQGRPSAVSKIASMNSHDFLAACLPEGESKSQISRRLESWLATQSIDAHFNTCRRAVASLISNQKLRKDPHSGLYFIGPNA